MYWAGWISMHTRKKQALMREERAGAGEGRLWFGLALLGFTSFYREGFEVVLFLQSYRIRHGGRPVFFGVLIGMILSGMIAILTFVVHRRLPFRRMLVLTGIMLGGVLLVMAGEQAQEMQLVCWLPKTDLPSLARIVPPWMGLWLSVFPPSRQFRPSALLQVLFSVPILRPVRTCRAVQVNHCALPGILSYNCGPSQRQRPGSATTVDGLAP